MTTTLRFPARMIEALALGAHEAAYRERGDRYATVEEMAMHRADPLACDDMVMPAIRAALDISAEFDRGYRVRRDGQDVIEFINHWDETDVSAPAYVGTEFRIFEAPAQEPCSGEIALADGHVFKWMIESTEAPEVYGWVEKDWAIVKGTSGWFRTADPEKAARLAQGNLG